MENHTTTRTVCLATLFVLTAILSAPTTTAQGPVISELMARNASVHRDPTDQHLHDWIELHNPTAAPINLTAWFLTDDPTNLRKWRFPTTNLAAGGYLLVYASGLDRKVAGQPIHTNFELDGDGEFLALVESDGTTIANVLTPAYPKQFPDLSFGRAGSVGTLGFFENPTPGTANPATSLIAVAGKVAADVPRGRFDAPIAVTLTSPTAGATIRYTTNGSKPTRTNGTLYTAPIAIAKSTILRAVAYTPILATSKAATFSYLYLADVKTQSATQPGYPTVWGQHRAPWGMVTRPSDYGMDPTITTSPVYGPMLDESLESLPIVSIVAEIDDLFDQQTGIYSQPGGTGEPWERPASVEFLAPRMGRSQQSDVGIRISGLRSRLGYLNAKHSFRLLFKENYGATDLDANLFGAGAAQEHNTLVLRSIYSDGFTGTMLLLRETAIYMRDQFVRQSQLDSGAAAPHGYYCHLFLNGMYWGLYNPSERPDAAFQVEYHGGRRAEWDVLKHFTGVVVDGDRVAYDAAQTIANGGLASAAAYASIQQYIDIQNLADYMIINQYCATDDWPNNNWYMARRRAPGEQFKFYCWDAELALWSVFLDRVNVNHTDGPAFFYHRLRANPEFRMLYADRAQKLLLRDGPMTQANSTARLRKLMAVVRPAIVAESARWGDYLKTPPYTLLNDWDPDANYELNVFFPRRTSRMLSHLRAADLFPSVAAPDFSNYGGTLQGAVSLTMTAPGTTTGKIYYTTDDSDPRQPGGAVGSTATTYTAPVAITTDTVVKARVLDGTTWSPLTDATFRRPNLTINEALAQNLTGITDPAGEREDWFEIHNPTGRAIVASRMYVTDDLRNPTKWQIPAGLTLQPGATVLVWADNHLTQAGLHASFRLSVRGEGVFLFAADGKTRLGGFHFGPQVADVSVGRLRDGDEASPVVTFPTPTPGQSNEISCGLRRYNSQEQDLHTMTLDGVGTARLNSQVTFQLRNAPANAPTLMMYSRSAGYWNGLEPANSVTFLLGPPIGRALVQTDAQGQFDFRLRIGHDLNLVGLRLYMQMFTFGPEGVRGSNGLEIAFCR